MIKELKIQAFSFEVPILDTLVIVCYDHNTDEFFAYLTEYIYDKILEQVDEEYKQEKSKRESDLLEATKEIPS